MKKYIYTILYLIVWAKSYAQNLIPYQVQDLKKWDDKQLWGYKDKNFNIVIKPVNEAPNLFENGYCVLVKNGDKGLMNDKGQIIIPPNRFGCSNVEADVVELQETLFKPSYFFNIKTWETVATNDEPKNIRYDILGVDSLLLSKNYDNVKKETNYGLVDYSNKVVLPNIYKYISKVDDGILKVRTKDDLEGYINAKGEWIVKPIYNFADDFKDGLALVKQNNKWGYMNKTGKIILPIKYDKANFFANGYTGVTIGNTLSIIDKTGKILFSNNEIKRIEYSFSNGIFIIKSKNDSSYIYDKNGVKQNIGANQIVSYDGENFILRIGATAYSLFNKKLLKCTNNNVSSVYAYKMGMYNVVNNTENDGQENITVYNHLNNGIVFESRDYKCSEVDYLGILKIYWQTSVPDPHYGSVHKENIYSYFNGAGRSYSDITK